MGMSVGFLMRRAGAGERIDRVDALYLGVVAALVAGLANRLFGGLTAPFWFDETFTGVIATQRTGAGLWEWLTHELGGPVYYLVVWAWEKVAGSGSIALRLPSLAASIATPLFILWRGHPDRRVALIWASLVALYTPAFSEATEARSYALVMLLTAVQAALFLRLISAPGTALASLWVAVSGLAILTHYHAAVISLVQGLAYLGHCRGRALKTWPAAFVLLPFLAWGAAHMHFLLSYATSGQTWYNPLRPGAITQLPGVFFAYPLLGDVLAPAMLLSGAVALARKDVGERLRFTHADALTFGSGGVAALVIFGIGCISASFTTRYLLPYVPAVLLGLAVWMRGLDRFYPRASMVLLLVMSVLSLGFLRIALAHPENDRRHYLEFEQASQWIADNGQADHLVFFWDNPTGDFSDPAHMREVGGFFLNRAGRHVTVHVPQIAPGVDPAPRLLDAASRLPDAAILWLYDRSVPGTRGITHPVAVADFRGWRCRIFGRPPESSIVACVPDSSAA